MPSGINFKKRIPSIIIDTLKFDCCIISLPCLCILYEYNTNQIVHLTHICVLRLRLHYSAQELKRLGQFELNATWKDQWWFTPWRATETMTCFAMKYHWHYNCIDLMSWQSHQDKGPWIKLNSESRSEWLITNGWCGGNEMENWARKWSANRALDLPIPYDLEFAYTI